ncbi:UNVERIFIED_CONTAM: hypothetical protein FKN15_043369 [Acipenser sinensis]
MTPAITKVTINAHQHVAHSMMHGRRNFTPEVEVQYAVTVTTTAGPLEVQAHVISMSGQTTDTRRDFHSITMTITTDPVGIPVHVTGMSGQSRDEKRAPSCTTVTHRVQYYNNNQGEYIFLNRRVLETGISWRWGPVSSYPD